MQILISTLAILICIILVFGIHELGHAIAAKCFGIKITKVSIGLGKDIHCFKAKPLKKLTIAMWPIGASVHLLNTRVTTVDPKDYSVCFDKKPILVRIIVLLAGSLLNFIVAYLALIFMLMLGFKQFPSVVDNVQVNSRAAISGIENKAQITAIAGKPTPYWRDVGMQLLINTGKECVSISTCNQQNLCNKHILNLKKLWKDNAKDLSLFAAIGITPKASQTDIVVVKALHFMPALKNAWFQLCDLLYFLLAMMKQVILANIPFAALLGPFKFFETMIDSFSQGLATFLYFIGNFSLAMGVANLLPIPSLDGGSICYTLLEKIRGRPISIALEILIYRLASIAFMIFFVQLILNDFRNYNGL